MTTSATVPVTVTPEAAARIAELGFQAHVDRMIEHARQHVLELDRVELVLYDRYELGDEPGLAVEVYSRRPYGYGNQDGRNLLRWMAREFPPEVLQHVIMDYHPEGGRAG